MLLCPFENLSYQYCLGKGEHCKRLWTYHSRDCSLKITMKSRNTSHLCFYELLKWYFVFYLLFLFLFQHKAWWQCMSIYTFGSIWTTPEPTIESFLNSFQKIFTDLNKKLEKKWECITKIHDITENFTTYNMSFHNLQMDVWLK